VERGGSVDRLTKPDVRGGEGEKQQGGAEKKKIIHGTYHIAAEGGGLIKTAAESAKISLRPLPGPDKVSVRGGDR
jgi:hypothetical protein